MLKQLSKLSKIHVILNAVVILLLMMKMAARYDSKGQMKRRVSGDRHLSLTSSNQSHTETVTHRLPWDVQNQLGKALQGLGQPRRINWKPRGETLGTANSENRMLSDLKPWSHFISSIRRHLFYSESDWILHQLINNMRTLNITEITERPREGTEFKFFMKLSDGTPIIAKPKRLPVDVEAPPEMNKNDFYERFQSEVAAFHLSKVLRLHLVPPVVSRYVNLMSEIYPLAPEALRKTFFKRQDGATCFTGNCEKKCTKKHAICGNPDVLPVSIALLLPATTINAWLLNYGYIPLQQSNCHLLKVNIRKISKAPRTYLDILDISVFDYLQGNLDRHHYAQFVKFGQNSQVVLFDNGRGFARSYQDEHQLLNPLRQCCQIRLSTFIKLWNVYQKKGRLSAAMKASLESESVQPLVPESHLTALDRRLVKVLETVYDCLSRVRTNITSVLVDDGY